MIISCQRFVSLITEAREGKLGAYQRAAFRLHGTVCPRCQCYVEGLDTTLALLHELPPEPAPDALRAEILARLRARKTGG